MKPTSVQIEKNSDRLTIKAIFQTGEEFRFSLRSNGYTWATKEFPNARLSPSQGKEICDMFAIGKGDETGIEKFKRLKVTMSEMKSLADLAAACNHPS